MGPVPPVWLGSALAAAALLSTVTGCSTPAGTSDPAAAGGTGGVVQQSGGSAAVGNGGSGAMAGSMPGGGGDSIGGSGGLATAGNAGGGMAGAGGGDDDWYPCDGSTDDYDVVMAGSDGDWTVSGGTADESSFATMEEALLDSYGRLTPNRSVKESILVQGSGSISASSQPKLPSFVVLNLCGTIDVTESASGSDRAPLYGRDRTDIDIPHATITGNAQYGMFFRNVNNLHLGRITLQMNIADSGLGIDRVARL